MSQSLINSSMLGRRLAALSATGLLDSPAERRFDRLTSLVAAALNVPVAAISLVDQDRQFFKSHVGLAGEAAERRQTPLSHSFCRHVVETEAPLVVHDARNTALVADNPAIDELGVEAYLGVPIADRSGTVIGSLCAIDHAPRKWNETDLDVLVDVCTIVQREIAEIRSSDETSQAEHLSRTLLNAMPQIVWLTDREGEPAGFNASWLAFTGMPVNSVLSWLDYLHPDDREAAEALWRHTLATEHSFDTIFRVRSHTGVHHAMLVRGVPLRDENGAVARFVCTGTDIQPLKDAEAASAQAKKDLVEDIVVRLSDAAGYVGDAEFQAIRGVIGSLRELVAA